jgi:hypothetical protein
MNWTNSDAVSFREFNKTSGGKLLKYLSAQIPKCNGKSIEEVALQAKYKEGFEFALQEIDFLLNFDDKEQDPSAGKFTEM